MNKLTRCYRSVAFAVAVSLFALETLAAVGEEFLKNGDFESLGTQDSAGVYKSADWAGSVYSCSPDSAFRPNDGCSGFVQGNYCGFLSNNRYLEQDFDVTSSCYATLTWKCKHRTADQEQKKNSIYYTVFLDDKVIWPEEEVLVDSVVMYRRIDNIRLTPGKHKFKIQCRINDKNYSTVFFDDISLRNMGNTVTELLVNGGFEVSTNRTDGVMGYPIQGWSGGCYSGLTGSAYNPDHNKKFINEGWCGIIQTHKAATQVFTNKFTCIATLSWRCRRRTNSGTTTPMHYTVMLDGNAIDSEQTITADDGAKIFEKSIEAIKLRPGEHTLVFQGRTDEKEVVNGRVKYHDESLFLDDVSLKVDRVLPRFSIIVR